MILSLSVRIAESFASKEKAALPLDALAGLASAAGYKGLCMRASQAGIHSPPEEVARAAALVRQCGLQVTMVTGNFDIVYNNDAGPACLRQIRPHLELAKTFGAPMIRVALKSAADIPWAQHAADEALALDLKLVHQCHTQSLFETVAGIEQTLQAIHRPNFGLVFEPANLELCGQSYGLETMDRLAPWIFNVYLQNQRLTPEGSVSLNTWCRGPVRFELMPIHASGGIDFRAVFEGLAAIGYAGPITAHQAQIPLEPVDHTARETAAFLIQLGRDCGMRP
ncbi:MAG: TIM barrel protein [Verrucomicrobiota bacterium]|jgi:sugar phosphate isomerase/epimerase